MPDSTEPLLLDRRWLVPGAVLAVAALVAALVAWWLTDANGVVWNMLDLGVYRWGGEQARTGGDLYGAMFPADQVVTGYHGGDLPFTYTPAAALLFVIPSLVPFTVAQVLWILVCAAATGVIVGVSLRALGYTAGPGRWGLVLGLAVLAFGLEPLFQTVGLGQINLVLVALCLWDLCLPDDSRWKGIGVGLATAVKLTPAIFIVYLLATRQWRSAGRAVLAAGVATGLAFLVLPGPSWDYWIDGVFRDASRVGGLAYAGNQSINGLLVRLLGSGTVESVLWLALSAVVLAAVLVVAVRWDQRGDRLPAIVMVALGGLLVSPVTWSHHWVWVVPAAVIGIDAVRRGVPRAGWLLAAGLVAFAAPGVIWRVPHNRDAERDWNAFQVVVGNLYIWIGLGAVAVALLAVLDRRTVPATPSPDPLR